MIASLQDAWRWYESVKELTQSMARLGRKHWGQLPWDGDLGRDERLRALDPADVQERADRVLADLNDLCVLLLFSVFEAIVRDSVLRQVSQEASALRHPALVHAVEVMKESIEHGSFYKVMESHKGPENDLIEEVNQVRRYRNWVAHGRRSLQPAMVDPQMAFDRLTRFLERFGLVE